MKPNPQPAPASQSECQVSASPTVQTLSRIESAPSHNKGEQAAEAATKEGE